MAAMAGIARRYDSYFEARPILTMMITNSVGHQLHPVVKRKKKEKRKKGKKHMLILERVPGPQWYSRHRRAIGHCHP